MARRQHALQRSLTEHARRPRVAVSRVGAIPEILKMRQHRIRVAGLDKLKRGPAVMSGNRLVPEPGRRPDRDRRSVAPAAARSRTTGFRPETV